MKRYRIDLTTEQSLQLAYRLNALGINAERRYGWAVWPDQEEALRQAVRDIAPAATLVEVVGKRDDQGREYWAPVEALR